MRARYAVLAEGSPQPDALKVALAGVAGDAVAGAPMSLAQRAADADAFAGWVGRMKARFRESPAPVAAPAPAPAPRVIKAAAPSKPGSAARKA